MKQCLSTLDNWQCNTVIPIEENKQGEPYNCPSLRSGGIFHTIAQGVKPKEIPEFSMHWRNRDQCSGRSRQLNLQDRSQLHRERESSRDMQKALLTFWLATDLHMCEKKLLTHSLGKNHQKSANQIIPGIQTELRIVCVPTSQSRKIY